MTRREILKASLGGAAAVGLGGVLALPGPAARREAPGRTPVRFWHLWTAEWQGVVERIVAEFNRSQDRYEVIPLSIPSAGSEAKCLLAAAGGDPPDVMAQWNLVLPTWAENGVLQPLDELMTPAERRLFRGQAYPFAQKVGTFRGHVYAIGLGPNLLACYYRTDHFRAVGLDPDRFPATLEALTAAAEKLHRFDRDGHLTRIGFLPEQFTQLAVLFGGGFYDERSGQVTLNTPQNLRALQFLAEQHRRLGYENVVRFTSGLAGDSSGGIDWPFISGAYSITLDGQWRVEQLEKFAPRLAYRTAPLPPPSGGRAKAGWATADMLLIPRGSKQPRGAWEFIRFWTGLELPERAARFYIWGGWLPITDALARAPAYQAYLRQHPTFRTFIDLLPSDNLEPPPPVPYQAFLSDRIGRTQDRVVRGTLTPRQALAQLAADVAKEQARRRELGYAE
jgi:multiple sugar transport system substrate-binding protein